MASASHSSDSLFLGWVHVRDYSWDHTMFTPWVLKQNHKRKPKCAKMHKIGLSNETEQQQNKDMGEEEREGRRKDAPRLHRRWQRSAEQLAMRGPLPSEATAPTALGQGSPLPQLGSVTPVTQASHLFQKPDSYLMAFKDIKPVLLGEWKELGRTR